MQQSYLDYLYNLGEFNIKLGLDNIRNMLSRLGNPHRHPRIIHIAGTNGKGSTLRMLESLLLKNGYTTGSTISPHLVTYNERFRINGESIDEATLNRTFETVCRKCGIDLSLKKAVSDDGTIRPTFFEFSIAIAFLIFRERAVDYILLETGLGGRLDATNVVEHPIAAAITKIAVDHQEFLGESIFEIANEKLGISKDGTPLFIAPQDDRVRDHILAYCQERQIGCFYHPRHFQAEKKVSGNTDIKLEFQLSSGINVDRTLTVDQLGILGDHQIDNLMTALAIYHGVVPPEKQLSLPDIGHVLKNLSWPARLEYIDEQRSILIDGAHNESGIRTLLEYLEKQHTSSKVIIAIGWSKGKNIIEAFQAFDCTKYLFMPIQGSNIRSESNESITVLLRENGYLVLPRATISELVHQVRNKELPENDLLVLAGSLYLLGEFLSEWHKKA